MIGHRTVLLAILLAVSLAAEATPLAAPGDMRLRHDLQLLSDSGVINVPLTAWPMALGDIHGALRDADISELSGTTRAAYDRVREHLSWELETGAVGFNLRLAAAELPRVVRTFEATPREDGEVSAGFTWLGERFVVNLAATYAENPLDGDDFRPDGTYLGVDSNARTKRGFSEAASPILKPTVPVSSSQARCSRTRSKAAFDDALSSEVSAVLKAR
jgi:hypothetical protein